MHTKDASESEEETMGAVRQLAHRLHLPTTFVKFVIVGGVGFVIFQFFLFLIYDSPVFWFLPSQDTSLDLGLFTHSDIRLLIASIVAVEIAIICQFNLHDRWTFRWRPRAGWIGQRFIKFQVSSIMSPTIVVVTVNALTPALRSAAGDESFIGTLAPYISSAIGVLLGFAWNWTLNSLIIWPHRRKADDERQTVS
ncbi:MAG: GtrA family protein [Chloroflexi bacterium]|nr:GtrA family protein [Chloroflexota bacterium]